MARFARHDDTRRSWPRRLLIAFNILLAIVLIAGVGGLAYGNWRFGQIGKIDIPGLREGRSGDPMNVLLVGSDSRADLAPGQNRKFGSATQVAGQRSDTIMILHVNPKAQRAAILSLPRDLYVTIADTGGKSRINEAFEGGPDRLIKTIQENFGIPIDHYAQVNFDSFKGIVDAVGGVEIPFASPARDFGEGRNLSGLNVPRAGCVTLTGDQALAYVRSRHYQVFEGGRWRADPSGDIGRINRQQDFIRRVIRKSIDKASNPVTLNSLIATGVRNVQFDEGFGIRDVAQLARRFQSLDSSQVEMMTIPSTNDNVNGATVLRIKQPEASQTIERFLNGQPKAEEGKQLPAIAPSSISIRVLNGSGITGQASEAGDELQKAGFVVSQVGDGNTASVTTIRYAKDQKNKAETLARYIQGESKLVADPTLKGVDAIITTGANFDGVSVPGAPVKAKETTTTSPGTTAPSKFVPGESPTC